MKPRALLLLVATVALFAAGDALAEIRWRGPGWYQVANGDMDAYFVAGPFANETDCKRTLPAEDKKAFYTCEHHTEKPWWDGPVPWERD